MKQKILATSVGKRRDKCEEWKKGVISWKKKHVLHEISPHIALMAPIISTKCSSYLKPQIGIEARFIVLLEAQQNLELVIWLIFVE